MNAAVTLLAHAEGYLAERHRLGYGLRTSAYAIRSFAGHVDDLGHEGPLTVELMAAWARRVPGHRGRPTQCWARRLKQLRSFARWMQQFDPRTEVPDDSIFGRVGERLAPHIYTDQEVIDLLGAARRLKTPLRGATYEALFGLIAATGLRVSEAVHLLDADVDLHSGMLTVRQTKFRKSRHVALHPSATAALRRYRRQRDLYIARTEHTPFFVNTRGRSLGTALSLRQVHRVFAQLRDQLGWGQSGCPRRDTHPRPSPQLHRYPCAALARRRSGHRSGHAGPVDLRRSCGGDQYLLVPHRRARAHGTGRESVRTAPVERGGGPCLKPLPVVRLRFQHWFRSSSPTTLSLSGP